MRSFCFGLILTALASVPAIAQPRLAPPKPAVAHPLDVGPFTPEANGAYQGGGMVLEGAPGAPAPTPQPTPPGQTPAHMVPPK